MAFWFFFVTFLPPQRSNQDENLNLYATKILPVSFYDSYASLLQRVGGGRGGGVGGMGGGESKFFAVRTVVVAGWVTQKVVGTVL